MSLSNDRRVSKARELIQSVMVNFEAMVGRISIEFPCRGSRGRLWVAEMELPDCFHRAALSAFQSSRVFELPSLRVALDESYTRHGISLSPVITTSVD